jgi:4-diphosphocytidyl-2-C-methyl-D-erythritol kinase
VSAPSAPLHERAFAKVNVVLHVGPRREDGLHELCSLLVSLELADELTIAPAGGDQDVVHCPGVEGENLAARALAGFRVGAGAELPPLALDVDKRIPIAAGLGGGSADAAAVLRAANEISGARLDAEGLRSLAAQVGADVPSQIEPAHVLVRGAGERVEPVSLPEMWLVLVPSPHGLSTAEVYAELDRLGGGRERLDVESLRELDGASLSTLAGAVENDLERAALSLRPELAAALHHLHDAGALAAALSGSGPTAFGLFGDPDSARAAASSIPRALSVAARASGGSRYR